MKCILQMVHDSTSFVILSGIFANFGWSERGLMILVSEKECQILDLIQLNCIPTPFGILAHVVETSLGVSLGFF